MTSLGIFKTKVFKFIPIFNRHHKELQTMKNVNKVVCKGISVHTLPEIKQKKYQNYQKAVFPEMRAFIIHLSWSVSQSTKETHTYKYKRFMISFLISFLRPLNSCYISQSIRLFIRVFLCLLLLVSDVSYEDFIRNHMCDKQL